MYKRLDGLENDSDKYHDEQVTKCIMERLQSVNLIIMKGLQYIETQIQGFSIRWIR